MMFVVLLTGREEGTGWLKSPNLKLSLYCNHADKRIGAK
jgi:hypothetical protein